MKGRIVAVVAVCATVTAVIAQAALATPPEAAPSARSLTLATVTPDLVCPGPETLVVPRGGKPVTARGQVVQSVVAVPRSVLLAGASTAGSTAPLGPVRTTGSDSTLASLTPLTPASTMPGRRLAPQVPRGAGTVRAVATVAGAARVRVEAQAVESSSIGATQTTLSAGGDLRGLVATTCAAPVADTWLVGGSTQAGRRLRLLLANAGPTAVTVDVAVHGPAGRVAAPSGQGVVVPSRREVAVFVDALAPGLARTAVHVSARDGRIAATLHDSLLNGLVAAGVDDVPPAAPASRTQVVPGLAYSPIPVTAAQAPDGGDAARAGATAVRVVVPGSRGALARVRLFGPQGLVDLPGGGILEVPGGGVADLAVAGVPGGLYGAVVDADVPVVASAIVGRAVAGSELSGPVAGAAGLVRPAEFGWTASTPPLAGTGVLALPTAVTARLVLTAPPGPEGAADSTSSPAASTGQDRRDGVVLVREIDARGSVGPPQAVSIAPGTTGALTMAATTTAIVVTADPSGAPVVAALMLVAADPAGQLISLLPIVSGADIAPDSPQLVADQTLGLR